MSKVSIKIGFGFNEEKEVDIHDDKIIERPYTGDVLRNRRRFEQMDTLSGGVVINNQFSIVGDTFLFDNLDRIRYVYYKNSNWTVSAEEAYPRVTLTLGGLYNGQTPETERLN